MDDIPKPFPANPSRFMNQLRAFMRSKQLAYKTKKNVLFLDQTIYSIL